MPTSHNDYKKIRKEGGSRVIAVGTLLPPDWKVVKLVHLYTIGGDRVFVKIVKIA